MPAPKTADSVASSVQRSGAEPKYGYILGDLAAGGKIYSKLNENQFFGNGASMNKPVLALIQLIMYRNQPEKQLTNQELKGLLSYTGFESNHVNRLITGRDPINSRLKKRQNIIGTVSATQASRYLQKLGLDPSMRIRFGNTQANSQTPRQYFFFIKGYTTKKKKKKLAKQKKKKKKKKKPKKKKKIFRVKKKKKKKKKTPSKKKQKKKNQKKKKKK